MPIDPVCGAEIAEDECLVATYQGQNHYFCSEDCRQEFLEAPEEFMALGADVWFDADE